MTKSGPLLAPPTAVARLASGFQMLAKLSSFWLGLEMQMQQFLVEAIKKLIFGSGRRAESSPPECQIAVVWSLLSEGISLRQNGLRELQISLPF